MLSCMPICMAVTFNVPIGSVPKKLISNPQKKTRNNGDINGSKFLLHEFYLITRITVLNLQIQQLIQLSTINYQLSTINYQLSTINHQLSTINYQLLYPIFLSASLSNLKCFFVSSLNFNPFI